MSDVNIGTLSGRIELEDVFSSKIDRAIEGIKHLDEKMGGLGHRFVETTASFFTAETALELIKEGAHLAAEAIHEIIEVGSRAADVEAAFDHLQGGAERANAALSRLQSGVHGQISAMDLMQRANQNAAAGLALSNSQMDILTKSAYALSKVQGIDVKEAFDKVSNAMVTGRVRSIQLLTGRIDMLSAEERFAKSLGKTTEHLNEAGKIEAIRSAILEKLQNVTERVGETHERLADKIQRAHVQMENFKEDIAVQIANSPVIMAAYDGIHEAVQKAFGNNQGDLINNITHAVEEGAIAVMGYAKNTVEGGHYIVDVWYEVQNAYQHVGEGIQAITYAAEAAIYGVLKVADALPGTGQTMKAALASVSKDMDRLYNSMAIGEGIVESNRKKEAEWGKTLEGVGATIQGIQDKMKAAKAAESAHTAEIDHAAESRDKLNEKIKRSSDYLKETTADAKAEEK
jgi:hypothetical protein